MFRWFQLFQKFAILSLCRDVCFFMFLRLRKFLRIIAEKFFYRKHSMPVSPIMIEKIDATPCIQTANVYASNYLMAERARWLKSVPFFIVSSLDPSCSAETMRSVISGFNQHNGSRDLQQVSLPRQFKCLTHPKHYKKLLRKGK